MSEADKNQDQELHHLAALAAGYELEWVPEWPGGGCFMRRAVPEPPEPFSKRVPWRPLEDDGDALRLRNSLCVEIGNLIYYGVHVKAYRHPYPIVRIRLKFDQDTVAGCPSSKATDAVVRQAIFMAAVEIGRRIERQT